MQKDKSQVPVIWYTAIILRLSFYFLQLNIFTAISSGWFFAPLCSVLMVNDFICFKILDQREQHFDGM